LAIEKVIGNQPKQVLIPNDSYAFRTGNQLIFC